MNPNNISAASQAAATAAMLDQDYMRYTCAQTAVLRDRLSQSVRSFGLNVPDSETNFILIQFGLPANAQSADEHLRRRGILMQLKPALDSVANADDSASMAAQVLADKQADVDSLKKKAKQKAENELEVLREELAQYR